METMKVKELREKFGIRDSKNEYLEEQILELSQRKMFYIRPYRDNETGNVHIQYKQVFGYISEDESACIFIKDTEITGHNKNYMPMKRIHNCTEIKYGVYHDKVDDIIYCTTDDLQFCLDYEKEYVLRSNQKQINELEEELNRLKNQRIVFQRTE